MSILLDTQAFLWFLLDDKRLSSPARTTIERTEILYLSPASHWEIAIKIALGKYALPEPYTQFMEYVGCGEARTASFAIDAVPSSPHPTCYVLTQNLLANAVSDPLIIATGDVLTAYAQTWLDQVKADLNLTQGEMTMFIPDMPNVPPQDVPVMIAQANQAQASDVRTIRTIGVCHPAPNNNYSAENGLIPITSAGYYLQAFEHRTPTGPATATIVQQPKHGMLRPVTQADVGTILPSGGDPVNPAAALYFYLPDSNYVGKDTATIQMDFGGVKVNVKYYFQAINQGLGDDWVGDYCSKTGPFWKISTTLNPDGTNTITSVEYQSSITNVASTDAAALASTLESSILSNLPTASDVTFNFADLPGAVCRMR